MATSVAWVRAGGKLALPIGSPSCFGYYRKMRRESRKKVVPKRRGRPATGRDPVSAIRLSPTLKSKIDNWAKQQGDQPSRSGAIRRLLNLALNSERTIKEGAPPSKVPGGTKNDTKFIVAVRRVAGFQIRAARAVLGWSAEDLARESAVSLRTIRRAELTDVQTSMTVANDLSVRRALEAAGIEFIEENGGGPGVRLRKPRQKER
jgi:DNA-binding XRE family transcriptional regulator